MQYHCNSERDLVYEGSKLLFKTTLSPTDIFSCVILFFFFFFMVLIFRVGFFATGSSKRPSWKQTSSSRRSSRASRRNKTSCNVRSIFFINCHNFLRAHWLDSPRGNVYGIINHDRIRNTRSYILLTALLLLSKRINVYA